MGKADKRKLYVGPGGWVWFGIVKILGYSVFGEKREKGVRGSIILYNFASASFGLLAYI